MDQLKLDLRTLRDLTYQLYDGSILEDGSIMCPERCVIEQSDSTSYVMLFDFNGELFYQRKVSNLILSTIHELCGVCDVTVSTVDLTK
jgi:hypothetical protein